MNKLSILKLLEVADIVLYIRELVDWTTFRALCNAAKVFRDIKLRYTRWSLTDEASFLYLIDRRFRDKVRRTMWETKNQLSLRFTEGYKLRGQDLTVLSDLDGIKIVESDICDVSMLSEVKHIYIEECNEVRDVSALRDAVVLNLISCNGVMDVSALGNISTLCIRDCVGVTDVSALERVRVLDLSLCENICSVSALGGVYSG